jgi:hypothetical protein
MSSAIYDVVFSEPAGRPNTLVHFAGALLLSSGYIYAWSIGEASAVSWLLMMMGASTVAGLAESLPTSCRQGAGILRLVAIPVWLCLIAAGIFVPVLILE